MSRNHRRSLKAETRLETLEGRVTPTGSMSLSGMGAQVLALNPGWGDAQSGLPTGVARALKQYEHIHNANRAEVFLSHHHRLENWLEQVAREQNAPVTTVPTPANGGSAGTTQNSGTTPAQPGTGTTASPSNPGTDSPTGTQGPAPAAQPITTTAGTSAFHNPTSPATTGSLDAILGQIAQVYKQGGIEQVKREFSGMAVFSGDNVGVEIHGNGGDFQELAAEVASLDSKISVSASDSTHQMIDAYVPITDLASLAADADHLVGSLTAMTPPSLN